MLLAALLTALCSPAASSAQAPVAPPGFFGVNVNGYQSGDFRPMADADVGVARNVVPFQVLKHGRDEPFFWGYTDPIVQGLADNGIDLIPMIYGAPSWISHDLNRTVVKGESARAWDDLLTALVQRYGPGGQFWWEHPYTPYRPIQTWQIWNEPNSITWWGPKPDPTEYAKVLVRSANTIRALDPSARIVTAGIVAKPTNRKAIPGTKFLTKLFSQPGVTEAVSAVAFHPYAPSVTAVRKQLVSARKVLKRKGAGATPLIVTEIGWGAKGPQDHPLIKSVAAQSRTMRATFEMVLREKDRLGIERLLWYQWRDAPDDLCLWCETSGLLDRKSRPKKLLTTFTSIATR